MNRLLVKFRSGFAQAQLEETEFHSSLIGESLRCLRGQYQPRGSSGGTFSWTAGVIGLSVLLLKSKMHSLGRSDSSSDDGGICSNLFEGAGALDSSLAKRPKWILDMFGLDGSDAPICQRMFLRRNPERKRPGPVWVFLNTFFLDPANISVWLDDRELTEVSELRGLLNLIGYTDGEVESSVVSGGEGLEAHSPRKGTHVLISFLDHFVLETSGYGVSRKRDLVIEEECRQALRLALLAFDCVYIPAVSYVQSPLCKRLLDEHRSQIRLGAIQLLSDASTWREFVSVRRGEYGKGSKERALYSSAEVLASLEEFPLRATERDTTRALHREWMKAIQEGAFREHVLGAPESAMDNPEQHVGILTCAAEDLGARAFIARHLQESLKRQALSVAESRLTRAICDLFFSHFCSQIGLEIFDTLAFVREVKTRGGSRVYSYGEMVRVLRAQQPEIFHELLACHPDELWKLKRDVASLGFV